jgi:hypothetical protein
LNDKQRKELIPSLDEFFAKADDLRKEIQYLLDSNGLYKDPILIPVSNASFDLARTVQEASDKLKGAGTQWVKSYVIAWYRAIHYDIDPTFVIAEEDIKDPEILSVKYKGHNRWEVLMSSLTHGKELVLIDSDTSSWEQIYHVIPMDEELGPPPDGNLRLTIIVFRHSKRSPLHHNTVYSDKFTEHMAVFQSYNPDVIIEKVYSLLLPVKQAKDGDDRWDPALFTVNTNLDAIERGEKP